MFCCCIVIAECELIECFLSGLTVSVQQNPEFVFDNGSPLIRLMGSKTCPCSLVCCLWHWVFNVFCGHILCNDIVVDWDTSGSRWDSVCSWWLVARSHQPGQHCRRHTELLQRHQFSGGLAQDCSWPTKTVSPVASYSAGQLCVVCFHRLLHQWLQIDYH